MLGENVGGFARQIMKELEVDFQQEHYVLLSLWRKEEKLVLRKGLIISGNDQEGVLERDVRQGQGMGCGVKKEKGRRCGQVTTF